jgi:myo-inositol-1(or 4)-monophosphatase
MITETNYYLISLNSSLGFAYVAIRKVDGFLNIHNHPWDICASSFLIQQAGGVITDLTGKPWTLTSVGAIAAKNKDIHKKILETFLNS